MDFKEKLDTFMKNNAIDNLRQLALRCDIPYTTLRDCYEKNNADNSRMATIRKLANYMNCTTDYLGYSEIELPEATNVEPEYELNLDQKDETDQLLFSKAKMLNEEEKKTIISIMDAIHKDIDKELDK